MSDIKVTVKDETNSTSVQRISSKPSTSQKASEKLDPKNEASDKAKKDNQGLAIATMVATRTFSYCTSNVNKWTGNSRNQQTVGKIQQGLSVATGFMVNPILGLSMAGCEIGTTAFNAAWDNRNENEKSKLKMLKAGYSDYNQVIGGRK